ncbi:MAG: 16S rRNA (cytosine(1402)-N(4))-methyltransferase RsmH [Proteobacteria bacterium]|nr:16S rRNA (cytosine(1402)-N(4))-methyltransferase RsmH [Pseudomonadota bacterium]MCL2307178.1 16S rRNA (cytosine(1402)-N(4))-methyltransferase RsmH [Pseudomonadota bacterium]
MHHAPVLLNEVLAALQIRRDGVYVDGTFGRGGHSRAMLAQLGEKGRVIALDRDPDAESVAFALMRDDPRFSFQRAWFSELPEVLSECAIHEVDGVLLDLGVSSPQIDDAERGFSFRHDGPLDMRMDPTRGESAAAFLARADQQQITEVLKHYGEERFAASIARAIVEARQERPIERTAQLAALVAQSLGARVRGDWHQDPATRTFQALRIQVNEELKEIMRLLPRLIAHLKTGARLAVISFHSLEDRLVKRFMRCAAQPFGGDETLLRLPLAQTALPEPPLRLVGRAIRAHEEEVNANPRARSAVLRVAERTAAPWGQKDVAHEVARLHAAAFGNAEVA